MPVRFWLGLLPLTVLVAGCSQSEAARTPPSPPAPRISASVATSPAPAGSPAKNSASEAKSGSTFIPPFPDKANPFAQPKVVVPVEQPKPEPPKAVVASPAPSPQAPAKKARPELRLVGFVQVSEPKALLSCEGQLNTLKIGDLIQEVEVVAIEPPQVTLRFDDEQFTMNLLEQGRRSGPPGAGAGARRLSPASPRYPATTPGGSGNYRPAGAPVAMAPPLPPGSAAAAAPQQPPNMPQLPVIKAPGDLPEVAAPPDGKSLRALPPPPQVP